MGGATCPAKLLINYAKFWGELRLQRGISAVEIFEIRPIHLVKKKQQKMKSLVGPRFRLLRAFEWHFAKQVSLAVLERAINT